MVLWIAAASGLALALLFGVLAYEAWQETRARKARERRLEEQSPRVKIIYPEDSHG